MNEGDKTYAEVMVEQLAKIADALEVLTSLPLPEELIMLYVQNKTRLSKGSIKAVFDAIKELNEKTKQTA